MLTIMAPAKLNLTLEVLARRPDGFHEIRSVLQTINLCDSLHFQLSRSTEFKCDVPDWVPTESLVPRAVDRLREASGCSEGVAIEISKHIPLMSGLGGDSSDAAATLRGLSNLWRLGLSAAELLALASQLGSDVAFFLCGGTALASGRGEVITPLPPLPQMWVVLLVPPVTRKPGKTARLYAGLEVGHHMPGQITSKLVACLNGGGGVTPSLLFNVFDGIALDSFPGLEVYWQQFSRAGAQDVHLAGSGPTLFTLERDRFRADRIYRRLQDRGLESYLVETGEYK